jgi:hypothetical protein
MSSPVIGHQPLTTATTVWPTSPLRRPNLVDGTQHDQHIPLPRGTTMIVRSCRQASDPDGLRQAIREVLRDAAWQGCYVHSRK